MTDSQAVYSNDKEQGHVHEEQFAEEQYGELYYSDEDEDGDDPWDDIEAAVMEGGSNRAVQPGAEPNSNARAGTFRGSDKDLGMSKKDLNSALERKYGDRISGAISKAERLEEKNRVRTTDKSDRATVELVLDPRTKMILFKMIVRGEFESLYGCISTGKEANVYHAMTADGTDRAIKVYKTSILVFKDRDRYVSGEFRFRKGYSRHNPRKMVKMWAEKEMRNLMRLKKAGVPCPEPLQLRNHVLLMTFLGKEGRAAPRLKDVNFHDTEAATELYRQICLSLRRMYQEAHLIHGDFSEYNILLFKGLPYIIDVGQAVEHEHPQAFDFLRRDIVNITDFFRRQGVMCMALKQAFDFITDITLPKEEAQVERHLEMLMQQAGDQQPADLTPDQAAEEAVFKQAYIPRSLHEVVDVEKDIAKIKEGNTDGIYYDKLTGLKDVTENSAMKPTAKTVSFEHLNAEDVRVDRHAADDDEEDDEEDEEDEDDVEFEDRDEEDDESGDGTESDEDGEINDGAGSRNMDGNVLAAMDKKERKALVKEAKREKRANKIPKHVKKRKEKVSKMRRQGQKS
eukprot:Clim_evm13s9 gene=Clim_evmTU13s9